MTTKKRNRKVLVVLTTILFAGLIASTVYNSYSINKLKSQIDSNLNLEHTVKELAPTKGQNLSKNGTGEDKLTKGSNKMTQTDVSEEEEITQNEFARRNKADQKMLRQFLKNNERPAS
ncbi:hypothetical protein GCM10008090_29360 [Arenicella chitinivorans]|uniref:Uncharacterized protein n=1 Tax=Arenicella chitinivorans TaxID=1329800 RepID=A0A918RZS7_9GAMM|nr:hypothetical protein [Arenicella chitinivorans]GHA17791.1 hypothetical protein GCM10008090_29360 [Arenicella chitinivorans]